MKNAAKRKKQLKAAAVPPSKKVKIPNEKTGTEVSTARVLQFLRSRFNPLRSLTPELLGFYIDRFKIGYIRQLCLAWDSIKDRDDTIRLVTSLREKAVSRFDYHIEPIEGLDPADEARAEDQQEKVEYFFQHLEVTSAIDENKIGGQKLLVKQMMESVGSMYSVHEIVWRPQADGNLTAQMRHTPPWFFENITGKLRFLPQEGDAFGVDLDEGGWMITVGEGLMIATSIAYMFKLLPLRDWLTYCERNGMPGFVGTTDAPKGSPQWNAMFEAVSNMAADFAAIKNSSEKIDVIDFKGASANLPYEPLTKRMDAKISSMWRGGDLSTQSSGAHSQGRGSQRQEDEAEIILDDDVTTIDETINASVIKFIIEYIYGPDEDVLVRYATIVPPKEATAQDIAIDQFLVGAAPAGEGLSWEDSLKRYGRVAAQPGEPVLMAPKQDEQLPPGLGNEAEIREAASTIASIKKDLLPAQAKTLAIVDARIDQALAMDDAGFENALEAIISEIPDFLKQANVDPSRAELLFHAYSTAYLDGITLNPVSV